MALLVSVSTNKTEKVVGPKSAGIYIPIPIYNVCTDVNFLL